LLESAGAPLAVAADEGAGVVADDPELLFELPHAPMSRLPDTANASSRIGNRGLVLLIIETPPVLSRLDSSL
jgi:hypothetical protein